MAASFSQVDMLLLQLLGPVCLDAATTISCLLSTTFMWQCIRRLEQWRIAKLEEDARNDTWKKPAEMPEIRFGISGSCNMLVLGDRKSVV